MVLGSGAHYTSSAPSIAEGLAGCGMRGVGAGGLGGGFGFKVGARRAL